MTTHQNTNTRASTSLADGGVVGVEGHVAAPLLSSLNCGGGVKAPAGFLRDGTLSLTTCDAMRAETNPEGVE